MAVANSRTRTAALRRYPALAYLGGAVALALLLPSGLTLPNSGPSTLAEYAPVPGQGEGTADVAELGLGTSGGGPGIGENDAAVTTTTPDSENRESAVGGRIRRKAGTKRCVGTPPRQTEDPLSPPCVAFFDGDNFGATAKGVTKDEVTVVVEVASAASDQDKERTAECNGAPRPDEDYRDFVCSAFQNYFNDRYQTYDRRVRFVLSRDNREASWAGVESRFKPFASVRLGENAAAARSGTIAVSFLGNGSGYYSRNAPYAVSFRSDLTHQVATMADFACTKLHDLPARFAGDATLRSKPRKFGVWSSSSSFRADELVRQMQERCGLTTALKLSQYQDAAGAARMQQEGVTTVILVDFFEAGAATVTTQATRSQWFPEWVVFGSNEQRGLDTNYYGRFANSTQWANAFGVTFDYRRDEPVSQAFSRAYREGCSACAPLTASQSYPAASTYDALTMLFYGIQAAGPKLTVANFDKGMHAIPAKGSADPYAPAAYFGPGDYTFLKDATAIWWDPTGQPPGGGSPGCYRLAHDGRRFRVGEWLGGDADLKAPGACQGDIAFGG